MHAIKAARSMRTFSLVTCNNSRGRKAGIRRSKEERKSMVETFIQKYQKSNCGNFPTINLTHKEVGGSYYIVRQIVREIIQENKVLGPTKLHPEDHPDQISLERFSLGSDNTVDKDKASGLPVYTESLAREIPEGVFQDPNRHVRIEIPEASSVVDVAVEKFPTKATSIPIDNIEEKIGDAPFRTKREQDGGDFLEKTYALVNENVSETLESQAVEGKTDVVNKETVHQEFGKSSLQNLTSSRDKLASGAVNAEDTYAATIESSNGSSHKILVAEESLTINNTPTAPQTGTHLKDRASPENIETQKSETKESSKSEINPVVGLMKSFYTAFVKFWT
ncbi:unnamed protein product [Cuscuta epithymum]|uniref:AT3G52170-like helix-turn-helix domain-containing protein n=1 Tax=Cuscuta epithymum TaxID=186058 RepID=A0AAV0GKT1_9ASTE|nr:unnamed protein product [Cuscuta epithymum]